ncbi:hypothetical protein, partial [Streptomyces anulatus]|uniref:hypothetical protein n=1 Tax=Streptomyces anulatus TaxID=1892 RepID=UPI003679E074
AVSLHCEIALKTPVRLVSVRCPSGLMEDVSPVTAISDLPSYLDIHGPLEFFSIGLPSGGEDRGYALPGQYEVLGEGGEYVSLG